MSNIRIPADLPIEDRQNNIKRFLQLVGEQHDVQFVFSGPPKTDGRTVWLGDIDSEDFEIRALGHGLHEMLHLAETDMKWFADLKAGNLEKTLFNILEDVRIDTIGMRRFGAYRAWRAELMERQEASGNLRTAADPKTLSTIELIETWLHAELLSELNVSWALRHRNRLRAQIDTRAGDRRPDVLLRIAERVHQAKNSHETFHIAAALARRIHDFGEEKDETPEVASSNPSTDSLDAKAAPSPAQFFHAAWIESLQEGSGGSNPTPSATVPKRSGTTLGLWPQMQTNDRLIADAAEYGPVFRGRLEHLQRLSQRFEALLRVRVDEGDEMGTETGDAFGSDFVSRLAANDRRVFTRSIPHHDVQAHCILLIDRSGSMGVERMTCAKVAYSALALALDKIAGVQTTCAAFPGFDRTPLLSLKAANESVHQLLERMSVLGAFGATPMAEALDWARSMLHDSDQALRQVVLITDGVYPPSRIEETARKYKEDRIELAVLNIDTENPGLCENTVSVSKTEDIDSALLTLMRQAKTMRELR